MIKMSQKRIIMGIIRIICIIMPTLPTLPMFAMPFLMNFDMSTRLKGDEHYLKDEEILNRKIHLKKIPKSR